MKAPGTKTIHAELDDLIRLLNTLMDVAWACEISSRHAEQAGDEALAAFFRETAQEESTWILRGKEILYQRLMKIGANALLQAKARVGEDPQHTDLPQKILVPSMIQGQRGGKRRVVPKKNPLERHSVAIEQGKSQNSIGEKHHTISRRIL